LSVANWVAVSKAVNERMNELGMTQKRLAELSNVSPSTLRKIQHGHPQQRNAVTLTAICRALRLPDDYLQRIAEGNSPAEALQNDSAELAALRTEVADLRKRVEAIEARLPSSVSAGD
jgi:transcriptional regulator with XRE-family HTH domain